MKLLATIIIILFVSGCSQYGEIVKDTIYLKFPIKVSLEKLEGDWKLDYTFADYPGTFDLKIKDVKRIIINGYSIEGNFEARLRNISEEAYKKDDDYFFTTLVITTPEESIDSVFHKFQTQNVINYVDFYDGHSIIIDMENYIRYFFYESGDIYINDIRIMYENRLY